MNIRETAEAIRETILKKQEELGLSFTEEGHLYTLDGYEKPISVTGLVARYYPGFDAEAKSLKMCGGNEEEAEQLRAEWKEKGRVAAETGSYVHYELEKYLIEIFDMDKEVRKPVFNIGEDDIKRGDLCIEQGKLQIDEMLERGGYLVDTEIVMGSTKDGYVGQCDCLWLVVNEDMPMGYELCLADWKTSKPKSFMALPYNKPMFEPFGFLVDNGVGKYEVQLCLYERLLKQMLEGSEFEHAVYNRPIIVALEGKDGTYEEYFTKDETKLATNSITFN